MATARAAAYPQIRFVEGDARSWRSDEPFDAIIGRLILFHLPDSVSVLKHHIAAPGPGGLVVGLDFDIGAIRTEPPVPLVAVTAARLIAAFKKVRESGSMFLPPVLACAWGRTIGP
jgi:trans-aconitate methyltransferase